MNSEIDRETNPSYTLQVSATDGGGLTALTKVYDTSYEVEINVVLENNGQYCKLICGEGSAQ